MANTLNNLLLQSRGRKISLNTYRTLLFIGGCIYYIFCFLFEFINPLATVNLDIVVFICLACFIIVGASFYVEIVRQRIGLLCLGLAYLATLHIGYLLWINNINTFYWLCCLSAVLCFSLLATTAKQMLYYFLVVFLSFTTISFIRTPLPDALFKTGLSAVLLYVFYIIQGARLRSENNAVNNAFLLSTLLDEAPDAFLFIDYKTGIVLECNQKTAIILKASDKNEIVGKPITEFANPDVWEKEKESVVQALKNQGSYSSEMLGKNMLGQPVWLQVAFRVIEISKESFIMLSAQDITQRVEAARELQLTQSKLTSVFESSSDQIWAIDKSYSLLAFNNAYLLYNIKFRNHLVVIGESFELSDKDPSDREWKNLFDNALQGKTIVKELRSAIPGNKQFFEHSLNPIYDEKGEIMGVTIFSRNITERKIAERETEKRDALLKGLADASQCLLENANFSQSLGEALSIFGNNWEAADRIFLVENKNLEAKEIPEREILKVWTRNEEVNLQNSQNGHSKNLIPEVCFSELQSGIVIKKTLRDFDENLRQCIDANVASIICVPIFAETSFIGFIRVDQFEEEYKWNQTEETFLKAFADTISAAMIRERNMRDLIEAKEEALSSAKAKQQFLANMSHEIRTPMNGIIGLTSMLNQTPLNLKQKEYAGAIQQSSKFLLAIINDILDFSKIEAGKVVIENEPFNLKELMENVFQLYQNKANEKGLRFILNVDAEIPLYVSGDSLRLNQILLNLISNAIKFTDLGKVEMEANLADKKGELTLITFHVRDTGAGISEDKVKSIFESFHQIENHFNKRHQGTGLGLSIVKRLVELQNSQVYVDTVPGKGSDFYFTLRYETVDTKRYLNENRIEQLVLHPLNNCRILVAEDNKVNQLLTKDLIESWGAEVDIADNGELALVKLKHQSYDMMLMDLHMPELNGFETTEIIRKYFPEKLNQIPIIAITANVLQSDRQKCLAIGMNDYITKPFQAAELNQMLWKYLPEEYRKSNDFEMTPYTNGHTPELYNGDVIKLDFLKSYANGNEAFVGKIIAMMCNTLPEAMNELITLAQNRDWVTVKARAHKLKATVGLLGNETLNREIRTIEDKAQHPSDESNLVKLISDFKNKMDTVVTELENAQVFYQA
jgi:PAS domain S-box-containing protein